METNNQNKVVSKMKETVNSFSNSISQNERMRKYRNFEINLMESSLPIVWQTGNAIIIFSYISALVIYIQNLYSLRDFSLGFFFFSFLCFCIIIYFWRIFLEFAATQFTQVKLLREIRDHLKKQE